MTGHVSTSQKPKHLAAELLMRLRSCAHETQQRWLVESQPGQKRGKQPSWAKLISRPNSDNKIDRSNDNGNSNNDNNNERK